MVQYKCLWYFDWLTDWLADWLTDYVAANYKLVISDRPDVSQTVRTQAAEEDQEMQSKLRLMILRWRHSVAASEGESSLQFTVYILQFTVYM